MTAILQGFRVVVLWDECAYIAVLVDHDVMAQGPTRREALKRLDGTITDQRLLAQIDGRTDELPENIPPPPSTRRYERRWLETVN